MTDLNKMMNIICPAFGMLGAYLIAHDKILTKWKTLLDLHQTMCEKLISDLEKSNPEELNYPTTIHYLVGFVYSHEKLTARGTLLGLRSFLVGLWLYVIGPLSVLYFIVYTIFVLAESPIFYYLLSVFAIFTIIFSSVVWALRKEEKKYGMPYNPDEAIKRIGKKICKDQKHFIIE